MIQVATLIAVALYTTHAVNAQADHYGQCGGTGWTGPTTCVSPYVCIKLNEWYSQCLESPSCSPGTTTTITSYVTTTTTIRPTTTSTIRPSTSSSSSRPPSSTGLSGLPYLKGVNEAGYDFTVKIDGSFTGNGVTPPSGQFPHFANQGVNIFRVPFAWQLMTPTLGGTIDSSFFSRYDATVQQGLSTGAYVILDLHNYARWNGAIINQGGPTIAQYTSIWTQLATKYKSNPKIIAVVNAIRAAGATSQVILIPGSSWSSAQALPTEAGPQLLTVTDPAGGVSKLVFDVHKYLDSDNSGTHTECTTDNVGVFQTLVAWLKQNNRQALLSETGGGNTQSCITAVKSQLAYVKSAYPYMLGFTMWSAGAFDNTYELVLTPNSDGTDQILWTQAVVPNF